MPSTRGLDRLVFFTDAIAAIAITLLILPLVDAVTQAPHGLGAGRFLADNATELTAFVLSFLVIARLWMAHHAIFEHVKDYTGVLVFLNLAWSLTVVFLPLPTEMISQFTTGPASIGIYIGTMAISSLILTVIVLVIRGNPAIELATNPVKDRVVFSSVSTSALFFVALALGVLVPAANFYALLLLLLSGPLDWLYDRRQAKAQSPAQ